MIKILFICHGNICRSPMAEFIFKSMIASEGLEANFEVSSAATSREEIGNDMYPPAKKTLKEHGIYFDKRSARQITVGDLEYYDYIIVMEEYNLINLRRMFPEAALNNVSLLMPYAGKNEDVSDPWYFGNFDKTYSDIYEGCKGLLSKLAESQKVLD